MKTFLKAALLVVFSCSTCFADGAHNEELQKQGKTTVHNAQFSNDNYAPSEKTQKKLDEVAKYMAKNTDVAFDVVCYTGDEGSEAYCRRVSAKRADWINNYFTEKGVDPERLKTAGAGIWKDENGTKSKTGKVEVKVKQ
jgi:outer membrane protein OmpA-like peptidoglycan-associated protein